MIRRHSEEEYDAGSLSQLAKGTQSLRNRHYYLYAKIVLTVKRGGIPGVQKMKFLKRPVV
jgi:hypothetical protein